MIRVYFTQDDTYTLHKSKDKRLQHETGSNKWRIGDLVSVMQEGDTEPWEGEVTDVTLKKITVYFEKSL